MVSCPQITPPAGNPVPASPAVRAQFWDSPIYGPTSKHQQQAHEHTQRGIQPQLLFLPTGDMGADTQVLQIWCLAFGTHTDFCPSSSPFSPLRRAAGSRSTSPAELSPAATAQAVLSQTTETQTSIDGTQENILPFHKVGHKVLKKVMQEAHKTQGTKQSAKTAGLALRLYPSSTS